MTARALHLAAFLSGVSALLFETLWFRQAGLAFGNGLWASALVLSSFMAGLALGSGLGARVGARLRRPARTYAALEAAIGASGVLLVFGLPHLTAVMAPAFHALGEHAFLLQPTRFGVSFALLVAPAVAMGATLPVLVRCAGSPTADFGRVLGGLYGWNTLGAVVGVATAELLWMPWAGVLGSAWVAAGFNAGAAALALAVAGDVARRVSAEPPPVRGALGASGARLLVASFLCGGLLLALEVVWFRFLSLYLATTSLAFAVMLAVVLAGIGAGSLLGSWLLGVRPSAHGSAGRLALAAGALCVASYVAFAPVLRAAGVRKSGAPLDVLALAAPLVLPVATCSGALFVLLGKRLHEVLDARVRSAGLLVLANTLGSMLGPLAAGFLLLPRLGMERSLFLLALGYGGVALLSARAPEPGRARVTPGGLAFAALFLAALLLFPHGLMRRAYLGVIEARLEARGERVVAVREGHLETIHYTRRDFLGEPLFHRLVTDGYSMSATNLGGRRYMELFAYLPAALHPRLRSALLISYGVGTTARSLANLRELERIDVVDISPEVIELSEIVFPDPAAHPLRDPRARVHVEDGRYFLESTPRRFDLVTGEPPPPAYAGVVNLYTREYFSRMRERLEVGGLATYWLPVIQLREQDAKAIVAAFCGAFETCTLWRGTAADWILLGAREPLAAVSDEDVRRRFRDPVVGPALAEIGVEAPAALAALFLADAPQLAAWVGETPPLVDDRPHRAPVPIPNWRELPGGLADLLDASAAHERFRRSGWVARTLPGSLRAASREDFEREELAARALAEPSELRLEALEEILDQGGRSALPLWMVGSSAPRQRAAEAARAHGRGGDTLAYELALGALAARDYARAASLFADVRGPRLRLRAGPREVFALCMGGRGREARRRLAAAEGLADEAAARLRAWTLGRCPDAAGASSPPAASAG